jgi:hypothetical protein
MLWSSKFLIIDQAGSLNYCLLTINMLHVSIIFRLTGSHEQNWEDIDPTETIYKCHGFDDDFPKKYRLKTV